MNRQPSNKVLLIIIGILLLVNITMILFYFINKPGAERPGFSDKKSFISSFLKNEAGFTAAQLSMFDSLSNKHRAETRLLYEQMAPQREIILRDVAHQSFNDTSIEHAAAEITGLQKRIEIKMLYHLKEIRQICNAGQLAKFDSGFYKMISNRREGTHKK